MYQIKNYYDKNYRGLSASETAADKDTMISIVHDFASEGGYIEVRNTETGELLHFDSDTYFENMYYEGEVSIDI